MFTATVYFYLKGEPTQIERFEADDLDGIQEVLMHFKRLLTKHDMSFIGSIIEEYQSIELRTNGRIEH